MKRGPTGRYETATAAGERVKAFVPAPLPPRPPVALDAAAQATLEQALLSLGRLDSLSGFVPDTRLFLYTYVRKEAVLSSQIEGTQSSLSDLLLFELDELPGVPMEDVVEVSNYVAALEHGLRRIRKGFPLSSRLIREVHEILLSRGRGAGKGPGEFRRSQNWLGGSRPGNAAFVPPPAHRVTDLMGALERFLHTDGAAPPLLLRAGLAHVQFESIHPFLDGNGRVGRLLITLMLCDGGMLTEPLLYLSLYLKRHRAEYYRLLGAVRTSGDWEAWLAFFLEGVHETSRSAVATALRVAALFREDHERVASAGRRAGSALRVHDALKERPMTSLTDVCARTGLSFPAASQAMEVLLGFDVARELTGKRRNRIFAYGRYVEVLNEGTEQA